VGALGRPYPILKSAGGKLRPENVRLSHVWCNNRDYGWRTQIRILLAKGKSLKEIAEILNSKDVPPAHGRNQWTAAMVRKAYVS
jgi:DNA-binding transcriptional MerR regulator